MLESSPAGGESLLRPSGVCWKQMPLSPRLFSLAALACTAIPASAKATEVRRLFSFFIEFIRVSGDRGQCRGFRHFSRVTR
ncbi:hypothetical protein D3C75_1255800 [compost metagenome]